ncbi:hypothetical protein RLDS_22415 [Sphingobium lactosutens DS20]|uniref:Uncharacterized protein n=1 Tax=Sphingobium lactosutens DS20 TaxID=1331060 RepID=T0IQH8_9SPHN|nr:hypothetical protein RLDS_22415 [Sphingobium lactosutens DS20]
MQQTRRFSFKTGYLPAPRPMARAGRYSFLIAWRRGVMPQPAHAGDL